MANSKADEPKINGPARAPSRYLNGLRQFLLPLARAAPAFYPAFSASANLRHGVAHRDFSQAALKAASNVALLICAEERALPGGEIGPRTIHRVNPLTLNPTSGRQAWISNLTARRRSLIGAAITQALHHVDGVTSITDSVLKGGQS
ncbi:hypothetical protein KM043_016588 [Ampulex compressa]|nr:hypothetical protein KM043_016588 [Ampulex compressa]